MTVVICDVIGFGSAPPGFVATSVGMTVVIAVAMDTGTATPGRAANSLGMTVVTPVPDGLDGSPVGASVVGATLGVATKCGAAPAGRAVVVYSQRVQSGTKMGSAVGPTMLGGARHLSGAPAVAGTRVGHAMLASGWAAGGQSLTGEGLMGLETLAATWAFVCEVNPREASLG